MQSVFDEYTMGSALNPMRAIPSDTGLMHGSPELDRWNEMMNNRTENQTNQGMGASSWRMAWLGVWALATGLLGMAQPALAAPASMQVVVSPSQTSYWRAGEIITYNYVLYHTGGTATDDITAPFTVTDSMLPLGTTITCPATPTKLDAVDTTGIPGITCKANYTVTAADVTRGYINNGTITANGGSASGTVTASLSPTSTVRIEHSPIRIFNLTAPNLVIDSNKAALGQGPKSFMAGATVCNVADEAISDVRMNIGNGVTAGVFPTTSCPAGGGIPQLTCSGSKPYTGNFILQMIDGYTEGAARLIGDLEPNAAMASAKCKTVYWPLKYDLVDAGGKPLFGATTPVADDIRWNYKIWANANILEAGVPVPHKSQLDAYVVGRSEITANPNKIDPTGATQTITPNPTGPGYLITTTFNNVDFSGADQGFDVYENNGAGDGKPDADIWFQPIGNGIWDTNMFRLVEVNATLRGSGSNCGTNGVTFSRRNQWYYPNMNAVDANGVPGGTFTCSGWRGDYSYTFMALKAGQAAISPYQEVASGANNEKYNGDYCGDTDGIESNVTL